MSDDEYRAILIKLIEDGRAFDAMCDLQQGAKNAIDSMQMAIREFDAERNTVIKICDSKEPNKHKVEAIRALME